MRGGLNRSFPKDYECQICQTRLFRNDRQGILLISAIIPGAGVAGVGADRSDAVYVHSDSL